MSRTWSKILIYIPLCFYFICFRLAVLLTFFLYLHSTMLLLYPDRDIDLGIHHRFTFHYASTLSRARASGGTPVDTFTFHYASTLSMFLPGLVCLNRHLHSTMLLLYPDLRQNRKTVCIRFTFHYASTLSPRLLLNLDILIHLHSTMLLLYLWLREKRHLSVKRFTFHYASTLSDKDVYTPHSQQDLHSTMLLLYHRTVIFWWFPFAFTFHYASTLSTDTGYYMNCKIIFTFHYASTLSPSWLLQP